MVNDNNHYQPDGAPADIDWTTSDPPWPAPVEDHPDTPWPTQAEGQADTAHHQDIQDHQGPHAHQPMADQQPAPDALIHLQSAPGMQCQTACTEDPAPQDEIQGPELPRAGSPARAAGTPPGLPSSGNCRKTASET